MYFLPGIYNNKNKSAIHLQEIVTFTSNIFWSPCSIFYTHFHSDIKLDDVFSLEPITFAGSDARQKYFH